MTGEIIQEQLAKKMFRKYSYLLTYDICTGLAEDIIDLSARENGLKYRRPLLEWLHGKRVFTDIQCNGFSLLELAVWLDEDCPNIPVASLLLMLEEDGGEYRAISAVAGEWCVADPKVIAGQICTVAGKSSGTWYFMLEDTSSEALREYQTWQVLVLNPALTLQLAYEHPDGTAIFLDENGVYVIVPPREDE